MRLILIFMLLLTGIGQAQPPGYLDSCNANPVLYDFFGPNCLNPVTWTLPGFHAIDTWLFFVKADGTTDAGQIKGYTWNPVQRSYDYWLLTEVPFGNYGGRFDAIPARQIIQVVQ